MEDKEYAIRTMSREEVGFAIELAAREGWNPGIEDAECFYSADPNGFLVGVLGNEPIGTISAVKYGTSFGFLGLYIVKPEYRGKGYGIQLWDAGLEYLAGRNVGLDGVVAQQENYKKSGFQYAYRNIRYEGRGGGDRPNNQEIVRLSSLPLEAINSYDRACFVERREEFLNAWIHQASCSAFGILDNGKFAGYGVIRKCRSDYKIGPLFADTPELAEALFLALRSEIDSSDSFYFDTPEVNRSAVRLAERYGMKVVFETARMYSDEEPGVPLDRVFGVTSFELG